VEIRTQGTVTIEVLHDDRVVFTDTKHVSGSQGSDG
jgi:hypothetical protein